MKHRVSPWWLLSGLAFATAVGATEVPKQTSNEAYAYYNGVKVAVDPATGRLRQPTPAELQQLRTALPAQARATHERKAPANEAEARKTLRKVPAGGVEIEIPEDRMSSVVATQRPDGTISIGHGDEAAPQDEGQANE
jgi:hypothetical protein